MITKSFKEVCEESVRNEALTSKDLKEQDTAVKTLIELMTPKYRTESLPSINLREALMASDMSILFPKAISDVLIRPKEPIMIGQTLLSRTVNAPNVKSFEFPVLGALTAADVAEGAEYPERQPDFGERFMEIRTNKAGLMLNVSEEVINESMWDILGILVEAAGFAMMRWKEEKIFNQAMEHGAVVFDNSVDDPNFWTSGKGSDQKRNFTVTFDDMLDTLGALVTHNYVPTDVVMHPMSWAVLAKDPILRAQYLTHGQIGQSVWSAMPDLNQQINTPWNIQYQVTPFVGIARKSLYKTNSGDTALDTNSSFEETNVSDMIFMDRNNSVMVLQRDPMSMENFQEFSRDSYKMKFKERYGVGVLNNGRSIATIKNIRLTQNYAPVLTVNQVSAA